MKHRILAAVAAIGLTVGLGAATSASAVVFAQFSGFGGVPNFKEDSLGNLTSTPATAPTVFTFDLTPLSGFGALQSTFTFAAHETAMATTGSIGGVSYVSAPFSGAFNYFYSGPTTTMGGVTLTTGELLLGGTFTNAVLEARSGADGGALTDDSIDGKVTYTSALPSSALPLAPGGKSFTLGFLNMTPVTALQHGFIRAFTAVGDGEFNSRLAGGSGIPEPAAWALMLTGVAGIGACLRRRQMAPWWA